MRHSPRPHGFSLHLFSTVEEPERRRSKVQDIIGGTFHLEGYLNSTMFEGLMADG